MDWNYGSQGAMRELKFRGRTSDGNIVFGGYLNKELDGILKHFIFNGKLVEVIDVEEFTGFKINEVDIYEGDYLSCEGHYQGDVWNKKYVGKVTWVDGEWRLVGTESVDLWEVVTNYGGKVC